MAASQGKVIDKELTRVVKGYTPADTREITNCVGLTRQATDYRLQKIEGRYLNP